MSMINDLILEEQYKRWQKLKGTSVLSEITRSELDKMVGDVGRDIRAQSGAPEPELGPSASVGYDEIELQMKNLHDAIRKIKMLDLGSSEKKVLADIVMRLRELSEQIPFIAKKAEKISKLSKADTVISEPTQVTQTQRMKPKT